MITFLLDAGKGAAACWLSLSFGSGEIIVWLSTIAVLALCLGAYARPYVNRGSIIVNKGNAEVVFVIDISSSMFLKDTGMARIDLATREIQKLLAKEVLKTGDKASLYVFGKMALRRVYLSTDLNRFSDEVSKIGLPKNLISDDIYWGSDVASAFTRIYESLDRQDMINTLSKGGTRDVDLKEPKGWRPKLKTNRIIILFSDGDFFNYDNSSSARDNLTHDKKVLDDAMREYRRRGLKVYSVGIGTKRGGALLEILKDYKKGQDYGDKLEEDLKGSFSRINLFNLEYFSTTTGSARPFLIESDGMDALPYLKSSIDENRSLSIEPSLNQDREDLWVSFLLAGLAVFSAGLLVTKF